MENVKIQWLLHELMRAIFVNLCALRECRRPNASAEIRVFAVDLSALATHDQSSFLLTIEAFW